MVIRVALISILLLGLCRAEEPPDKLALLVGIGDYPEEVNEGGLCDLPGAQNDPELIRNLLIERFGFAPENIKVLLNEQATHERIVKSFDEWLIRRAGPDTEAVFWYCGHGSRVPDRSGVGAEVDELDSTLVAWDSRLEGRNGSYDIPDDELGALVRALNRKTEWVTIVTDSCHSGGVTRGGSAGVVRAAPPGEEPFDRTLIEPFWPEDVPYSDDDRAALAPDSYVHIAACGPQQEAQEWDVDHQGVFYGALTYFLSFRLRELRHDTTYWSLIGAVETWIDAAAAADPKFKRQSVAVRGPADRKVFQNRFEERPPGFLAHARFDEQQRAGREITIDAGWLHGLQDGSVLMLTGFDGEEFGTATVERARAGKAWALLDGDWPPDVQIAGLLATEISRPGGQEPLQMVIVHADLSERVRKLCGDRVKVLAAPPESGPAYRIEVDPPGAGIEDPALARVWAPDGFLLWPGPSAIRDEQWLERVTGKLDELIAREFRYLGLLEVAGMQASMQDGYQVACSLQDPTGEELVQGEGLAGKWKGTMTPAGVRPLHGEESASTRKTYRSHDVQATYRSDQGESQLVRIDVTNESDDSLYFSVLSVSEAREIEVIHPERGGDFLIAPKTTRPVYAVLTHHDWFHELGRPMRDRYLVIATPEEADFHPLVQGSTHRGADGAVPPLIRNALSARVTRGGSRPVDTRGGQRFGVATATLLVDRAAQK